MQHYLSNKNLHGFNVELDDILRTDKAIELYNEWCGKQSLSTGIIDQNKNSRSLIIPSKDSKSDFEEKDNDGGFVPSKKRTSVNTPNQYLSPQRKFDNEDLSDDLNLPGFNDLPSVKKNKSFIIESINDNLNGKNKRFSVMKIMSDETKEKAKEIALNLAKSMFMKTGRKNSDKVFVIPAGFESSTIEVQVKEEILSLKEYIFTIQA